MSDLYREIESWQNPHTHDFRTATTCVTCGAIRRWVVKVEPCEHGNYAPHPKTTFQYEMVDGIEWFALTFCDGKPEATDV